MPGRGLGTDVAVRLWSPADARDKQWRCRCWSPTTAPSTPTWPGLTDYCAAMIASGALPPHWVALVAPGACNEWYLASPLYAGAPVRECCRRRRRGGRARRAGGDGRPARRAGDAARPAPSPGHVRRAVPQSGSFFTPEHDIQERGFSRWARVTAFAAEVLGGGRSGAAPAELTWWRRRGEPREQPRDGRRARRAATSRSPTCTTTRPGATRWTTSPTCWEPGGRRALRRAVLARDRRGGQRGRPRPLGPAVPRRLAERGNAWSTATAASSARSPA